MKFNMGCGHSRLEGWVNVDKFPSPAVDQLVDLETLPWPWPDNCAETVRFAHSLEHMGETARGYLGIIGELYRICRHEAEVEITVPHPRHDHFLHDPTHVRPVTWESLACLDQDSNRRKIAAGAANTPLGLQLGVDFRITRVSHVLDEGWQDRIARGLARREDVEADARHYFNVIAETTIGLVAVKAPTSPGS